MHELRTAVRAPGIQVLAAETLVGQRPPDRGRGEHLALDPTKNGSLKMPWPSWRIGHQ